MNNFLDIVKNSGGWFEGHTVFKNGFHGDGWIEKGFIIRRPKVLDLVTSYQAELVSKYFPDTEIVIGPIVSGSVIASFVAKHLDKEFAITMGKEDEIEFHRMNIPKPPKKVVLIEDLVFTGTDVKANIKFLKEKGFEVEGSVVWVNRQKELAEEIKVISLLDTPPFNFYKAEECPLCMKNVPVKYNDIRE